jgi:hypothetical protein
MTPAAQAGATYFGLVFALGFALGTLRVLALAPYLGPTGAVLVELPIMLAASWVLCGWLIARFAVPPVWADRLLMGGLAFALLIIAELGVSVLAFGRSVTEHLATYQEVAAQVGLAAQVAFAAFPLIRGRP